MTRCQIFVSDILAVTKTKDIRNFNPSKRNQRLESMNVRIMIALEDAALWFRVINYCFSVK